MHKLLEYESNVFIYNDERKKAQDVACDENIKQILQGRIYLALFSGGSALKQLQYLSITDFNNRS